MTKEKKLIPDNLRWMTNICQYYDGEEQNPFGDHFADYPKYKTQGFNKEAKRLEKDMARIWWYEQMWCNIGISEIADSDVIDTYIANGLKDFMNDDGVPLSLKAWISACYFGWHNQEIDKFKQWYVNTYKKYGKNRKVSLGERVLCWYRLELLSRDDSDTIGYDEKDPIRFQIVRWVDGDLGYDCNIDERVMCRALEHAIIHGLTIEICPLCTNEDRCDGWEYIPDFKEIRYKALDYLNKKFVRDYAGNRYDTVNLCGIWKGRYVYSLSSSNQDPTKPYPIIGLPEALIVDGQKVSIEPNLIEIMYDLDEDWR